MSAVVIVGTSYRMLNERMPHYTEQLLLGGFKCSVEHGRFRTITKLVARKLAAKRLTVCRNEIKIIQTKNLLWEKNP